jgi:hypothetical protein
MLVQFLDHANDLIERDTQAMIARFHDAARANGAPTDLLVLSDA